MAVLPTTCSTRCSTYLAQLKVTPKAVFEDLHKDDAKQRVYPVIKPLAGVYLIINLVNGNTYVGSAITGNMPNRFHKHLFGFTGNKPVAAAVAIAFIVLDTIPDFIAKDNNLDLLALETQSLEHRKHGVYGRCGREITTLLPDYNVAPIAGNTLGVKHTEANKLKMRVNYSSERREQVRAINRGKTLSLETRALLQKAALLRPPMSDETRAKVSANSTVANLYSVTRVDGQPLSNGKMEMELRTINKVADFLSCDEKTVRRALASTGIVKKVHQVKVLGPALSMNKKV